MLSLPVSRLRRDVDSPVRPVTGRCCSLVLLFIPDAADETLHQALIMCQVGRTKGGADEKSQAKACTLKKMFNNVLL
jgi:hypothetical protein